MGLDGVELVLECEDCLGIKPADADAGRVFTVRGLQQLCARLAREQQAQPLNPAQEIGIREQVRVLIAEQMGIPLDRVTPGAELGRDLGVGR